MYPKIVSNAIIWRYTKSKRHIIDLKLLDRKTLSKIINERGSITPDMAARLSKAFNTTPELWLNLQQNHDLWHTLHDTSAWKSVHALAA